MVGGRQRLSTQASLSRHPHDTPVPGGDVEPGSALVGDAEGRRLQVCAYAYMPAACVSA